MTSKKLYIFLFVLICFACQKDPDTSKLDNDFPVYTDHDASVNFSTFTTYYIPDSVLIIDGNEKGRYWTDSDADQLITTFVGNLDARGFTRVDNRNTADLGLQVSYIENTSYFYDYYDDPYWWWGYPGYWGPGYWGGWGGWYYPYPVVYSYNTGSLLAEMVDLKTVSARADANLPVVWTAYMGGLLSGSNRVNIQLSIRAIDQAFTQSQYIRK